MPESGVEPRGHYITHQIKEHDQRRQEHSGAQNHGVVPVKGGLHIKSSQPGNLKNGLDHKRPRQQSCKGGS